MVLRAGPGGPIDLEKIMNKRCTTLCGFALGVIFMLGVPIKSSWGDAGHAHGGAAQPGMLEQAKKLHRGHKHAHEFEKMEDITPEQMQRVMSMMMELGLALPAVDSRSGRRLFLEKGCIVCHVVNGVGGDIGPSLNASDMPRTMNAFEFAARMWRGAPAMVQMQQQMLGDFINLTGKELAALVAFAHDLGEQRKVKAEQIPERYRKLIKEMK